MKIILDTDVCKEGGKDIDVIIYLLSLLSGSNITINTFEKARQQGLLKFEEMYNRADPFPTYVSLSKSGEYIVDSILAKSATKEAENKPKDRFEALAEKLMAIFPAGYKVFANGTKQPWRGNVSTISERLRKFVLRFPEHAKCTDDEFEDAAKRYVHDYIGKETMRLLLYFIFKNVNDAGDNTRISPLADYLTAKDAPQETSQYFGMTLR